MTELIDLPIVAGGVGAGVDTTDYGARKTMLLASVGGTVNVEFSNDGGVTWHQAGKSFRSNLQDQVVEIVAGLMRVDATNGTVSKAQVVAELSKARTGVIPAPPTNGPGASLDVSSFGCLSTIAVGDYDGTGSISVEISGDDVEWATIESFNKGGDKTLHFSAKYIRLNGNGATGKGSIGSIDAAAINARPLSDIVFAPSDPAGSRDNIYVTWDEVMVALSLLDSRNKILRFDATFANPVIPAGTHDMLNVKWTDTISPSAFPFIDILDGVLLPNLSSIEMEANPWSIFYDNQTDPVITYSSTLKIFSLTRESSGIAHLTPFRTTTKPFISVQSSFFVVKTGGFSVIGPETSNPTTPALFSDAPVIELLSSTCFFFASNGGIARNAWSGDGTLNMFLVNSPVNSNYGLEDQPNFTGTINTPEPLYNTRMAINDIGAGPGVIVWGNHVKTDTSSTFVQIDLIPARNRDGDEVEIKDTALNASAISLSGSPTAAFTKTDDVMTMTDGGAAFTAAIVGNAIIISGATSAGNNGTFLIVGQTATTVDYINAAGVAEAAGASAYSIPAISLNAFKAEVRGVSLTFTIDDGGGNSTITGFDPLDSGLSASGYGYNPGDSIDVLGADAANNGTHTIAELLANGVKLVGTPLGTDETVASGATVTHQDLIDGAVAATIAADAGAITTRVVGADGEISLVSSL